MTTFNIHEIANALNARPNSLGGYQGYCPNCQQTPEEQRKGRKFGLSVGRKQPIIYNCFRGCTYDQIKPLIDDLMKLSGYIDEKPQVFTANVHTETDEDYIRKQTVQCIMDNCEDAFDCPEVANYFDNFNVNELNGNLWYSRKIIGHEGLSIPEPNRSSVVVVCTKDGLPIGGQRILINPDGSRATNRAGAKLSKYTFGFIRGNPYRLAPRPNCLTKALLVTESAETATVIHEATAFSETWAVFGVGNFKTIPLMDPPIPLTKPVIFFPDMDSYGSQAHTAIQNAIAEHRMNGYRVFEIYPPEERGSGNNFADSASRLGMEAVRVYIRNAYSDIVRSVRNSQ